MNTRKTIKFYLSAILLTGACQVLAASQNEPTSWRVPDTKTGPGLRGGTGVDGGGGNRLASLHPSKEAIKTWIEFIKGPASLVLKRIEMVTGKPTSETSPLLVNLHKKLFAGKSTIYHALKEAQFQVQESGPCYDTSGKEVDGSAKDMPKICISSQRLSKSLTLENAQPELLALVIHEVSHMMGATEKEAMKIQEIARAGLSSNPLDEIPGTVRQLARDFIKTSLNLSFLTHPSTRLSRNELCLELGKEKQKITRMLTDAFQIMNTEGYLLLRPNQLFVFSAIYARATNMDSFCSKELHKQLKIIFEGRKEISLDEWVIKNYDPAFIKQMPVLNENIYQIEPGDEETLRLESKKLQGYLTWASLHFTGPNTEY